MYATKNLNYFLINLQKIRCLNDNLFSGTTTTMEPGTTVMPDCVEHGSHTLGENPHGWLEAGDKWMYQAYISK